MHGLSVGQMGRGKTTLHVSRVQEGGVQMNFEQKFAAVWGALIDLVQAVKTRIENISRCIRPFIQRGRILLKYMNLADVVRANTRPIQRPSIKETQMYMRPVTRRARSSC